MTDETKPKPPTIRERLRQCAAKTPDVFPPEWTQEARMLMIWAADVIDAADAALRERAK